MAGLKAARQFRASGAFCREMLASVPPGGEDEGMQLEGGAAKRVVAETLAGTPFASLAEANRPQPAAPETNG